MASDPSLAIQGSAYAVLTGAPFQSACGVATGVWDEVPANAAYPYVSIEDLQTTPNQAVGFDGSEVVLTAHVWSRKTGSVEAKRIADAVRDALAPVPGSAPPFSLAARGHVLIGWLAGGSRMLRDPNDPLAKHIPVRLIYQTQPAP